MNVVLHERFSKTVTSTRESVASYCRAADDTNAIYFDPVLAERACKGLLIANNTHTTALLFGLTADRLSKGTSMLMLKFWAAFKLPRNAAEVILLG